MSNETEITVQGWVGQHPRMSVTRSGETMATLRVGSTPRRRDGASGEWGDAQTSWFSVLVFGERADNVARSLRKGDPVLVRGRYSLKRSEYQGKEHLNAEIVANAIGPELGHGTALYAPMVRRGRDEGAGRAGEVTAADLRARGGAEEDAVADLSFALDLDEDGDGLGASDPRDEDLAGPAGDHPSDGEVYAVRDELDAGSGELVGTP